MNDERSYGKSFMELNYERSDGHDPHCSTEPLKIAANPSGIIPTGYKVVLAPEKGVVTTKLAAMGLHAADVTKERDDAAAIIGKLVAVSPLAFTYHEDWGDAQKPKVGDRVVIGKYCGTTLTGKDGEDYRIINDQDVISVLEF